MIEIETQRLADIPVLHAYPAKQNEKPLPCIVFYHGFTSSSLVYSYFAVALAQAGFRVIMPDAPDHGLRFSDDAGRRMYHFWQILHKNMEEFSAIREGIIAKNWLLDGRLAVSGASMGAMTALGIKARHTSIHCAASLMGSGYFTQLAQTLFPPLVPETPAQQKEFEAILAPLGQWEVTNKLSHLADSPLLLWHGRDDDVVPAIESYRLEQALTQAGLADNLTCQWQEGVRHRITPEALAATVNFFRQYL